jgi:putative MATE family efflux protein
MYATLLSVAINCILNPIFIFSFGWGIKGSAWATILSQSISLIFQMTHFYNKKNIIHFSKEIYVLQKKLVKKILSIGMSPFLMNICACLIVILINRGMREHGGDIAVGAYGIINRIIFMFIMIVMGFNQGMQPVAGYNYGAKNYSRVISVTKLTIFCGIGVTTIGFLVCEIFPSMMIKLFTTRPELIAEAVYGMRLMFCVFPLVGFQMVASNFFLSIGMSQKAIFLSMTRQVLFLIPCLLILPRFWGTFGIWISIPVSDFVSTVVTTIVLIDQFRKFKSIV